LSKNSSNLETSDKESQYSKYDPFSRYFLKISKYLIDIIINYLDNELTKDMDFESIEYQSENFVSSNLLKSSCDIIISLKSLSDPSLRYSFLILVEHQSEIDHYMSLRLVDYFIKMFLEIAVRNQSNKHFPLFPLPIAVVIHQGDKWNDFLGMSDLIVGANKYSPFYMGCHIKLIDLSDMPVEYLNVLPEVKAYFVALQSGSVGDFDLKLNYIISQLAQADRNDNFYLLLQNFISYALSLKNKSSQDFYIKNFQKLLLKRR
jgi:hypothetical protein